MLRTIVRGPKPVDVDIPDQQLSQRCKSILSEGGVPLTSRDHITVKFLNGANMKKMTEEVALLGADLSSKPGTENVSGRIIALLRPFFMTAVGSTETHHEDQAVAFSLNDAHVAELNSTPDGAKAVQQEGKTAVQQDIDATRADREARAPSTFYQVIVVAAYSYSSKVFNFGYAYTHREDLLLSQFLADTQTRARRLAAMSIECLTPLAEALVSTEDAHPPPITTHINGDRFNDQASLL